MQHRIANKPKISLKSVSNCNSYSGFSAGTQKMKCPVQAMAKAILTDC